MKTQQESCPFSGDFHEFPYAEPFSVNDFLQSLFGTQCFREIESFTPEIPNTRAGLGSQTAPFKKVFHGGSMNFTHFVSTNFTLHDSNVPDLLHLLLWQQQALQLAYNEEAWDIMIPIYFGNLKEPFETKRTSAM